MKTGIIVAMDSEYEALRAAGVSGVVKSGIGKVNAARATTELILKEKPDYIISSGLAGGISPVLKVGDFVIGNQTAYYDVWCGEGNQKGQVQGFPQRYCADADLLSIVRNLRMDGIRLHEGLICTGDRFITTYEEEETIKKIYPDALACEMESCAIAQVCYIYSIPFLSFRAISDVLVPGQSHQESYDGFMANLNANSFSMVRLLLESL